MLIYAKGRIMGDTQHELVCKFDNGDELQRLINPCGVPYSVIYTTRWGVVAEFFSCERSREEDMVKYYMKEYNAKKVL